jgi:hypothetical protein
VRILIVGPTDYGMVIDWWRYVDEDAEVPTQIEVILDLLTLGGERLTPEERRLSSLVPESRREDFARALLAHL